ncbi:MAG: RIP metalloprotease RseP [Patescibacteria group bacterium]
MNIIIFLIILLVLVLVHEFGHFFSAKKFGIRVDEFGFGFPPKLFGIKRGETEYTLNLLPLGGFVKIFGENPDEENINGPDAGRSFIHRPKYQQAIVLFAGIFMNFVLAWLLFSFGFLSGLPTSVNSDIGAYNVSDVHTVIVSVLPDSPAFKAGIKTGDKVVAVSYIDSKNKIEELREITPDTLKSFVLKHPNDEINISYIRGKDKVFENTKLTPEIKNGNPAIGVSMDQIGIAKLPVLKAIVEGMSLTINVTKGTVVGLYTLVRDGIQGKGSLDSVTGPVGMVGIVGDAYEFGFVYLISFAALISVNLAIINFLPFPALDGGRLFFLLIETIKGSPLNPKITNTANAIGFGLLLLLMLFVTYHDIVKLF